MHSWFTQKLNEMTALAHYCQFPILKAHFILTQKAVDDMYGKHQPSENDLQRILPLLLMQAESSNAFEVAKHLRRAIDSLEPSRMNNDKIVPVDFQLPLTERKQSGA